MAATDSALQFTVDDYLALPRQGPRYQLIEGDLIVSPSPDFQHQRSAGRLFVRLFLHVTGNGLGEVVCAPFDVILSEHDTVQPDVLFVAEPRRSRIGARAVQGPPDLVVEVLSDDRRMDLEIKRKLYARHGVIEYWVVDPDAKLVHVYRLQEDPSKPARTFLIGEILESALFPGLRIPLAEIFAA